MKALKGILIFLLVIIASIGVYYAYLGGFSKVEVAEENVGPLDMVGIERWGDYGQTPQVLDSLANELKNFEVETNEAMGVYYDNPQISTKSPSEYYSIVGFILPQNEDSAKLKRLERAGFYINHMGKTPATVVHFPKKTRLSVFLGIFKAYPALKEYRKEKAYAPVPAFEIYKEKEIIYGMEIKK